MSVWRWTLEGVSATHHGSGDGHDEYTATVSAESGAEALVKIVESFAGFELFDLDEPFTLTMEPIQWREGDDT